MSPGALCIASTSALLGTEIPHSLLSLSSLCFLLLPAVMIWSSPSFRLHFSLTWEILPTICESSYRLPDFFCCCCYILQTRKLQNWSHGVTPWNETCGRSIVFPLCPKASPHERGCGHQSLRTSHFLLSRELGVT